MGQQICVKEKQKSFHVRPIKIQKQNQQNIDLPKTETYSEIPNSKISEQKSLLTKTTDCRSKKTLRSPIQLLKEDSESQVKSQFKKGSGRAEGLRDVSSIIEQQPVTVTMNRFNKGSPIKQENEIEQCVNIMKARKFNSYFNN